ncbi:efflux RND transporter periplasmic adaptor subunit [Paracoccus aestuariivivens]|uniref:Efflux RND transporter periplasmic adaptor subunit n=2 Tax=Paracoccus aestuariivivens TaxID=1820333 RepID=A0A6L6JFP4_9RHOB|nr:efflux RND transporter periplasmic adaptor subunit [Paracoccus aestuariivivens]
MIGFGMSSLPMPSVSRANEADAAIVTKEVAVVTTAKAEQIPVEARVPVTGSLVAREPVQIHANVTGYEIREIRADVGESVKAGDVLVVLDDEALVAQLAQAEAEYQRAEASVSQARSQIASAAATLTQAASQLERTRRLRQSGSAAQSVLDEVIATEASARAAAASASDGLGVANAQLAQADAARKIARLNLRHARITAPVDGVIVTRKAEIGALAGTDGEPMFTMIARGEIELAADVIETALAQIRTGDMVEVQLSGMGTINGKVRLIPAAIDPVTRLGQARISLDADPRLRIGLFASGWVITDRRDAVTVPASAVLADDEGERVQIVKDGVVETRPVKAGLTWQGQREVLEGLQPGEEVIARAGAFFRTGDEVRVVSPAAIADVQPDRTP